MKRNPEGLDWTTLLLIGGIGFALWWMFNKARSIRAVSTAVAEKASELFPSRSERILTEVLSTPAQQRPILRMGDRRPELIGFIVELQNRLGIPTDGVFGPQTRDAVIAFQRRVGLVPDGVVGPATWQALLTGKAIVSQSGQLITGESRGLIR
jgi:peptidoglycan hydrolase-like protein with peptidoglycan-binding domain